jgi:S-formylglutathione hydrolase
MTQNKTYNIERGTLTTPLVINNNAVKFSVLLPPNYTPNRQETYPVLLFLHGGGGTEEDLVTHVKPILELPFSPLIRMAEFVAVSFHCSSSNSFSGGGHYVDSFDDKNQWQRFILETLFPYMYNTYNVGCEKSCHLVVSGISMGGVGALRLAFRHPHQVKAVAALEPFMHATLSLKNRSAHQRAIDSSFKVTSNNIPDFLQPLVNSPGSPLDPENLGFGWDELRKLFHGDPVNEEHWQAWAPACIASNNAEKIRDSGLQIRVECGDNDEYEFQYAAEFLHRTLLSKNVLHEYHLVHAGSHMDLSLFSRLYFSLLFLSNAVLPPLKETDLGAMQAGSDANEAISHIVKWQMEERKKAAGYIDETSYVKYSQTEC